MQSNCVRWRYPGTRNGAETRTGGGAAVLILCLVNVLLLAGCSSSGKSSGTVDAGGAAGSSSSSGGASGVAPTWEAGVFASPSRFANQCEAPRTGTDPYSGQLFPDRPGTAMHEKMWLRSFTDVAYYWYDEVEDINPEPFSVPQYFDTVLRADHDQFHFSQPYESYMAAYEEGVSVDYGIVWEIRHSSDGFQVYIKQVTAQADAADFVYRGDEVLEIDGQPLAALNDVDMLIDWLYPEVVGETHSFTFRSAETEQLININLVAQPIQYASVPQYKILDTASGRTGYLEFYSHNMTSEPVLMEAVQHFYREGVEDLVVDMRYNQGGQLFVASQLAYMVAGPGRTTDRTFERFLYNDKHPTVSPFGDVITPIPFISSSLETSAGDEQPFPTLDLPRVFVLTTGETCSASESFINALRGIDVEVIQIGTPTCGKPYGYLPTQNCGMVYYMVMFTGVNDKGYGEFQSGFRASGSDQQDDEALLPGCEVVDDLAYPLGDPDEPLLAAALQYQATGDCPASGLQTSPFVSGFNNLKAGSPGQQLQRSLKLYKPPELPMN